MAAPKKRMRGRAIAGFVLTALLVLALGIPLAVSALNNRAEASTPPSSSSSTSTDSADKSDPALVAALTVTTVSDTAKCSTDQYGIVGFDIDALKKTPPRASSASLATPFSATKPADILREFQQSDCKDPHLGTAWAVFFAQDFRDWFLKTQGIDLVELNGWLKPFSADQLNIEDNGIATKAAEYIPLLNVKDPSSEQIDQALTKNRQWQAVAERLNTLLERFEVLGIQSRDSVVSYRVSAPVAGALPSVGRDPVTDTKPALVLSFTQKVGCTVAEVGINLEDKRPELFKPVCVTSTPTPTPSHTTPPRHTTPPTTPPHTTPPPTTCPTCVTPEQATQPVPTPAPQPSTVPTTEPSAQPTVPANTESPAPPTPGGYNGGSTEQPGATASPTPVVPTSDPTNSVDPGGF